MTIEQENIQLPTGDGELTVEADDDGIAIEIVVGAKQGGIIRAGVDHFAIGRGQHRGAKGVGNIHPMMGAIAITGGRTKLIGRAGQLTTDIRGKGAAHPVMVILRAGGRGKG